MGGGVSACASGKGEDMNDLAFKLDLGIDRETLSADLLLAVFPGEASQIRLICSQEAS